MTDCKHAALAAIDEKAPVVNAVSDGVWDCAELSLQEERSAALYCQVLEQEGFSVERGVLLVGGPVEGHRLLRVLWHRAAFHRPAGGI